MFEILIYDDIASGSLMMNDSVFSAKTLKQMLVDNPKEKDIKLSINCNGGSVREGLTIYDLLRASGRNIYTHIDGECHSMAVVILLAAPFENRTANPNATALIHRVQGGIEGNATDLEAAAKEMKNLEKKILEIYKQRTGQDADILRSLMDAEDFLTVQELKKYGFIARVTNYITNQKLNKMAKKNKASTPFLLAFINSKIVSLGLKKGGDMENYAFADMDGNPAFSTESETDELEVGTVVTLADGVTAGEFLLEDGRAVTIETDDEGVSTVTEIKEASEVVKEVVENTIKREKEFANTLAEIAKRVESLENSGGSNYEPPKKKQPAAKGAKGGDSKSMAKTWNDLRSGKK